MNQDTCVVVPVYNEGQVVRGTLAKLLEQYSFVVCVDDGSRDNSRAEIAKTGAHLVVHPINLGQGAALQTGIDFGLQYPHIQYFVTFDADGQHDAADVNKMLSHLREHDELDIVLGSRFLGASENMTPLKKMVLKAAVQFSNLTTGLHLSDAHNGLRVFNRKVAAALNITMPDMAHASEIVHRIAEQHFAYDELPVSIAYTNYSKNKGQSTMNAVNITFDLLLQKVAKK